MKIDRTTIVAILCGTLIFLCCAAILYVITWAGERTSEFIRKQTTEQVYEGTTLTRIAFPGDAVFVTFSKDSKFLIVGTNSFHKWQQKNWHSAVRVWDMETQKEIHCERFELLVRSISLHPDGKKVLIATSKGVTGWPSSKSPGQLAVFEFPSFRLLQKFEAGYAIVMGGAKFSPDGQLIGVHHKETMEYWDPEKITIFDSQDLKKIATIPDLTAMQAFEFTPDSRFIIGGHYIKLWAHAPQADRSVIDLYEARTGKLRHRFQRYGAGAFQHVNGRLLIVGNPMLVYESEEKISKLDDFHGGTDSENGRYRLSYTSEQIGNKRAYTRIALMDLRTGEKTEYYRDNTGRTVAPTCRAFSPDSKYFAVGRNSFRIVKADEPPGEWLGDVLLFTISD
jgi:WD40 repeat protein